jgi:hypothetical protein
MISPWGMRGKGIGIVDRPAVRGVSRSPSRRRPRPKEGSASKPVFRDWHPYNARQTVAVASLVRWAEEPAVDGKAQQPPGHVPQSQLHYKRRIPNY